MSTRININSYRTDQSPPFSIAAIATLLLWGTLFSDAITSAILVWSGSTTYNHCFTVLPIALYFAWQKKDRLSGLAPNPNFWVLAPVLAVTLIWALGTAGEIQLFTHFAAFTILPLMIWGIFGDKIARELWFPLLFTLFCIPIGEELVPLFQEITADISVTMLRWSSVPVYRDGLYITIPNGKFEVAEACSGIRFFIASICLAAVYSYVSYQKVWKRALFMVFAIALPIAANGARAYGIMMIGHLSNMEHAVGADHLVYGWVFFAFITLIMIFVGNIWAENPPAPSEKRERTHSRELTPVTRGLVIFSIPLILALLWKHTTLDQSYSSSLQPNLSAIPLRSSPNSSWAPQFINTDYEFSGITNQGIDLYIAWYANDSQNSELISSRNRLYMPDNWTLSSKTSLSLKHEGDPINLSLLDIRSSRSDNRLVAYWYALPGINSNNPIEVKIRQTVSKLQGKPSSGAVVAFSIQSRETSAEKRQRIENYIRSHYHQLQQALALNNKP